MIRKPVHPKMFALSNLHQFVDRAASVTKGSEEPLAAEGTNVRSI
jgi:hypothetical protein